MVPQIQPLPSDCRNCTQQPCAGVEGPSATIKDSTGAYLHLRFTVDSKVHYYCHCSTVLYCHQCCCRAPITIVTRNVAKLDDPSETTLRHVWGLRLMASRARTRTATATRVVGNSYLLSRQQLHWHSSITAKEWSAFALRLCPQTGYHSYSPTALSHFHITQSWAAMMHSSSSETATPSVSTKIITRSTAKLKFKIAVISAYLFSSTSFQRPLQITTERNCFAWQMKHYLIWIAVSATT